MQRYISSPIAAASCMKLGQQFANHIMSLILCFRCLSLLGMALRSRQALLLRPRPHQLPEQLLPLQKLNRRQLLRCQRRLQSRKLRPHNKKMQRREGRPQALTAKQVRFPSIQLGPQWHFPGVAKAEYLCLGLINIPLLDGGPVLVRLGQLWRGAKKPEM